MKSKRREKAGSSVSIEFEIQNTGWRLFSSIWLNQPLWEFAVLRCMGDGVRMSSASSKTNSTEES